VADLVIRINGDVKNFQDALDEAQEKTAELEDGLASVAKISGVAFAALTAEVGLSVAAFAESQKAARELTTAMQNQGIYSKELEDAYREQASELQKLTGVDDDAIVSATALLQAMVGQTRVSKELSLATLDLAAAKGLDLKSATELIGKGIDGQTGALKKLGIEIDEHLSKQERTDEIIKQVTQRFGGQAAAMNEGLGAVSGLKAAFGDFQEEIGLRFAPFVESAIKALTRFFERTSENKSVMDLVVALLTAGTAITGLIAGVGSLALVFLKLQAALTAAGVAVSVMGLAVKGLVGATGLGLLVVVATEIYLNWNSIWPRMVALFQASMLTIGNLAAGFGGLLAGALTFNPQLMKESLERLKNALSTGIAEYNKVAEKGLAERERLENESQARQDAAKKAAADREAANKAAEEAQKLERAKAERELMRMQLEGASNEALELKKREIELLKQLENEKYDAIRDIVLQKLEENRAAQVEQDAIDTEYRRARFEALLAENEEYEAMTDAQRAQFREKNEQALMSQIQTEESTRQNAAKKKSEEQIKAHNEYLANEQKFGQAYALIHSVMQSEVYRGTKNAFGELAALQQSENKELKEIGKAAAIANIVIKTGESAMNIYAGFSTIPIVGQALGIAGAAAAVLFGAEQIGKVTAAAQGGLLTGGVPGVDSIPVLAQQGELVSPTQNFEEVIGSVRAMREAEKMGGGFGGGGEARVVLELKDSLMDFIETKLVERANIGISLQGATS
jgi:hypothetical protein